MPEPRPNWSLTEVHDWLFREGRLTTDLHQFTAELGRRLVATGVPVSHLRLAFRTLHPQLAGFGYFWRRGCDCTEESYAEHSVLDTPRWQGSPAQAVLERGEIVHQRLDALTDEDHAAYHDYAVEGACDYLALPMLFSDGKWHALILATDHAAGFSRGDITQLRQLSEYLAPVLEAFGSHYLAKTLLDTYLGERSGDKVLRGLIRRGDGETINAAIWFSDLRDSTALAERLDPFQLLTLLNDFFELITDAVQANGGEVLRFIGDAMLIIFPAHSERDVPEACQRALIAAQTARAQLPALNQRRRDAGEAEIEFGTGLHVGELIHGNVGAPRRLDFTVTGAAVHRCARIESLTKRLKEPLLLSSHFASAIDWPCQSRGKHALKGLPYPIEVFAPVPIS